MLYDFVVNVEWRYPGNNAICAASIRLCNGRDAPWAATSPATTDALSRVLNILSITYECVKHRVRESQG